MKLRFTALRTSVLAIACLLGVFFWILDASVDARLSPEKTFVQQLLAPSAEEIGERVAILSLFLALGIYAQVIIQKLRGAEKAREVSEERLQLALEGAKEGFWDWNLASGEVFLSPEWTNMIGYRRDELTPGDQFWKDLVHPDDRGEVVKVMTAHLKGETPIYETEHRLRAKNGEWRWVLDHGRVIERDATGRAVRVVGTQIDITERKLAESELQGHRERLETLVAERTQELQKANEDLQLEISQRTKTEEAMWNIVKGTSATTGSEFFRSMVRHISLAMQVKYAYICQCTNDTKARVKTLASWAGTDYAKNVEYGVEGTPCEEVVKGNVCYYPVGVRDLFPEDRELAELGAESYLGIPVRDDSKKLLGHLVVMDDRPMDNYLLSMSVLSVFAARAGAELQRLDAEANRRQAEERSQHSQKLESLGVLAGGIAHDFNNLLVGVITNGHMALEDIPESSPARECVTEMVTSGTRASDLCQQLLAYSGKGKFLIEPVNLNDITLEMSHLLEAAISKKTVVRHEFAENLPFINADATQIRQVVMNLITNASEAFEGDSGSIRVSTGEVFCDGAFLNETEIGEDLHAGDYVFLEVQDWGCGMDEETVQKIFEPFFTTKFTGRGLGLSSVLGIVRSHRGAMRVLSQPGKGTTFTLYFPKIESAPHKETHVDLPGAFDWQGEGTVLLVDDDKVVRAAAKRVLEKMGFHVVLAADGHEAVSLFAEQDEDPACIVLDLTMAEMDGEETFGELRRANRNVPIVLSSGYAQPEIMERFAHKDVGGFVKKPYEPAELARAVRNAIEAGTPVKEPSIHAE